MSIQITGQDASFSIIWDELTLIIVVLAFCVAKVMVTYYKNIG